MMIELCTFRRMIFIVVVLIGMCVFILFLENAFTTDHDRKLQDPNVNDSERSCWLQEDFTIVEQCSLCSEFEKVSRHLPACDKTGFKELISCKNSGQVYRSCDKVLWLEERNFWIFEGVVFWTGLLAAIVAKVRQKQLDQKMMERIQRQIAAGV